MTQNASAPALVQLDDAPECRHYWVIQPATGPVSPGICQTCGEAREFKNYVEGAAWGDSRLSNRSTEDTATVVASPAADQDEDDED